jgi:hypothetical protein
MELRSQPMPSAADWTAATAVAAQLFGINGSSFLTAPGVADFVGQVKARAAALAATQPDLVAAIETAYERAGVDQGGSADRLTTARRAAELVQQLRHLDGVALVERLAGAGFGSGAAAAGKSMASAEQVAAALRGFQWDRLAPIRQGMQGEGERADAAAGILTRLQNALRADELVTGIAGALRTADSDIFTWLTPPVAIPTQQPNRAPAPIDPHHGGRARRAPGASNDDLLREVRQFLERNADREVDVSWQVRE